jgi:hypothetical protein
VRQSSFLSVKVMLISRRIEAESQQCVWTPHAPCS